MQGLVVANDDLAYYAQITLLNAVAFAAVVAYIMTVRASRRLPWSCLVCLVAVAWVDRYL